MPSAKAGVLFGPSAKVGREAPWVLVLYKEQVASTPGAAGQDEARTAFAQWGCTRAFSLQQSVKAGVAPLSYYTTETVWVRNTTENHRSLTLAFRVGYHCFRARGA